MKSKPRPPQSLLPGDSLSKQLPVFKGEGPSPAICPGLALGTRGLETEGFAVGFAAGEGGGSKCHGWLARAVLEFRFLASAAPRREARSSLEDADVEVDGFLDVPVHRVVAV